jgi:RNA polymerase sigma factor (sigma-70 family)
VLIKRYKGLVYSIARRYRARSEDAADIFQLVCVELFLSLEQLREHRSVRSWIAMIAQHQSYHWKRREILRADREGAAVGPTTVPPEAPGAMERSDLALRVRQAIARLPKRDQQLVRMLYFVDPPVPYEKVATRLGFATGSVSITRMRALKKLARIMAEPRPKRRSSSR